MAGALDGASVEDARSRLDDFLNAESAESSLDAEQVALRRALGVL